MPDDALLLALEQAVAAGRRADAEVLAHIAEVDARRLYLGRGCSSMFRYATEVLHMSESAAYRRITAARASRTFPVLLAMVAAGQLHLTGVAQLAPHLTRANCDAVVERAVHRTKRQIEELIAELAPRPDVPAAIRKLPAPRRAKAVEPRTEPHSTLTLGAAPAAPAKPAPPAVLPLAPARYKVQFTASRELRDKLDRLANQLRHQVPDGDLATLIELAVTDKLAAIDKRRYARTERPRASAPEAVSAQTRHIPAEVRRAVAERDGEQCTFVAANGRRCTERGGLEFHHRDPYARGGRHTAGNVTLLCRSHNGYAATLDFGEAFMDRFRSRAEEPRAPYRRLVPARVGFRVPRGAPAHGRRPQASPALRAKPGMASFNRAAPAPRRWRGSPLSFGTAVARRPGRLAVPVARGSPTSHHPHFYCPDAASEM